MFAASSENGFTVGVLQLISQGSLDQHCRLTAAIFLKNHFNTGWSDVPDNERAVVKENIVGVLLGTLDSPAIAKQLVASLSIIAKSDFPEHWKELLPQLTARLQTGGDPKVVLVTLKVIAAIMGVCKAMYESKEANAFLRYVLDVLFKPLLETFTKTCSAFDVDLARGKVLSVTEAEYTFKAIKAMASIFYSLNVITIPSEVRRHHGTVVQWVPQGAAL
jgi:exportin-2 (importin alpha re-exporter)